MYICNIYIWLYVYIYIHMLFNIHITCIYIYLYTPIFCRSTTPMTWWFWSNWTDWSLCPMYGYYRENGGGPVGMVPLNKSKPIYTLVGIYWVYHIPLATQTLPSVISLLRWWIWKLNRPALVMPFFIVCLESSKDHFENRGRQVIWP